jgi:hypothetical protein
LDDILIFSKIEIEHIEHIKKVLDKLKRARLLLKPEKYEFHKEELTFLGYIIGREGIRIDPAKVKAVLNWPALKIVKEVQAFLGFANFYRQFIKDYLKVAKLIIELTKKDQDFD